MSDEKPMGQVIQIDEARIRDHLGELVRGTVEETLNAMLDAEADQLCGAGRYERSQARQDTRAGSYERTLQTSAGEVNLKVPKLRRQTFERRTTRLPRRDCTRLPLPYWGGDPRIATALQDGGRTLRRADPDPARNDPIRRKHAFNCFRR